jgi:metal-responsive CopG/Arc/MetJ family transcriptional regulator
MKTQTTFTSTLPIQLMKELNDFAAHQKKNKKEIIVEALENYFLEAKRNEYAESFKKAAKDKEQQQLANAGLKDYIKHLSK